MVSPARAHFQRVAAAEASASAVSGGTLEGCTAYDLMLVKLAEDRRRLKNIQSMEAKAEVKREILPEYEPWIEGVLAAGKGVQDDVLMSVMVWRIDAGDYAGALDIAEYALRYNLSMPDRYERTTATVIAEEVADAAKRARDGKEPFDAATLDRTHQTTAEHDMPDQVRAKLHKELGLTLEETEPAAALAHLTRAKQLHEKVGVVKDIERLEKAVKNLADGEPASS